MAPRAECAEHFAMTHAVSTSRLDDDAQQLHWEAHVSRPLRELFRRLPTLEGFRVRSDFSVADVSATGSPNGTSHPRLRLSVMHALVELAECDSRALALMRGRSFSR